MNTAGTPPPDARRVLRQRAVSGVLWTAAASGAQQVLLLATFAVLARQLRPVEFGVMAMATIALEIVNLLGRASLVEVLVQRKELDEEQQSTAFWSSLALGLAGTLVLWCGAGFVGAFFDVQEVSRILQWLSIAPTINALGTVPEALLRRSIDFRILAWRSGVATLVSGVVAVAMAMAGFGVMSLVLQSLVAAALLTGVMWVHTRWRPAWKFSAAVFRQQLGMGTSLSASTLLGVGNQRVVDLVVGYLLGATQLGYLRIAWKGFESLLDLAMRPIVQVSFPVFARMQHDVSALAAAYVRVAQLTALIIYPVFIGAIVIAPEFIPLAFGAQWEASIPLMQILALSVLSMPMIYFKSNVLVALGYARPVLWLNLLEFGISFGLVLLFCRFGIEGAAWGNVLRVLVVVVPICWGLQHYVGIRWTELLRGMVPALACTCIMTTAATGARWLLAPYLPPFMLLAAVVAAGAICYVTAVFLLYRDLFTELASMAPGSLRRLLVSVNLLKAA